MYVYVLGVIVFVLFLSNVVTEDTLRVITDDLNTFNSAIYAIYGFARNKNLFCFPLPILSTLSLIYHGTQGNSAKEISNVLFSVKDPYGYDAVIKNLKQNSNITMSFDSTFYFKKRMTVKKNYIKILKQYTADIKFVDFQKLLNIMHTKLTVPSWATGRKSLSSDTRAMLVSRAQFIHRWKTPFSSVDTKNTKFYVINQDSVEVPMMNMRNALMKFAVSSYLESTVLEVPLAGDRFSMIFILPTDENGLSTNIGLKLYDTQTILNIVSKMKRKFLRRICIPKFNFERQMSLEQLVYELQIRDIFTQSADFSGITPDRININEGRHTAIIEVDETGVRSTSHVLTIIKSNYKPKVRSVVILPGNKKSNTSNLTRHKRKPINRPTTKKPSTMATFKTYAPNKSRSSQKRQNCRKTRSIPVGNYANFFQKSDEFLAVHPFAFLLFDYKLKMIVSFGKFSNYTEKN